MTSMETIILLDTLLPGGDGFPSASEAGLMVAMDQNTAFADAVVLVLSLVSEEFAAMEEGDRVLTLQRVEADNGVAFRDLTTLAYTAYYTAPKVLAVISAKTSYRHPPQPGGYILPEFDKSVLATARNNPVSWRSTT